MTTTTITIIFIVVSTLVAAFVRRIARDRCLKDFNDNTITLEKTNGTLVQGTVHVENTGLEIIYPCTDKQTPVQGDDPMQTSYLLYKAEFSSIQSIIRYHDQLDEKKRKKRELELKRTYHPGFWRRLKRKTKNIFKTVRDSVMEVINILLNQVKRSGSAGRVITSQNKYVTQMKTELIGSIGTSYEPLLEKYIGRKVVVELANNEHQPLLSGILKEYTGDFIEIMDVQYYCNTAQTTKKADLIIPRKFGIVRYLGE